MKQLNFNTNNKSVGVYESQGNGLPVFFFHGNSSSKDIYRELIHLNDSNYKFIAIDFPGHGNTPLDCWATEGITIRRLGEFAHEVISTYGCEEYIVVGQSIGGHALMESPSILKNALGICLLSSPPINSQSMERAFNKNSVMPLLFKGDLSISDVRELSIYFTGTTQSSLKKIVERDINCTDIRFRPLLAQGIDDVGIDDEIQALKGFAREILMIRGKHDRFLNESYFEALSKTNFWNNRIYELNCGHCISLENPVETYSILCEYIDSVVAKKNAIKNVVVESTPYA